MFVFSELCVRVASEGGRKANEAELVRVQHGADANYFPCMYRYTRILHVHTCLQSQAHAVVTWASSRYLSWESLIWSPRAGGARLWVRSQLTHMLFGRLAPNMGASHIRLSKGDRPRDHRPTESSPIGITQGSSRGHLEWRDPSVRPLWRGRARGAV